MDSMCSVNTERTTFCLILHLAYLRKIVIATFRILFIKLQHLYTVLVNEAVKIGSLFETVNFQFIVWFIDLTDMNQIKTTTEIKRRIYRNKIMVLKSETGFDNILKLILVKNMDHILLLLGWICHMWSAAMQGPIAMSEIITGPKILGTKDFGNQRFWRPKNLGPNILSSTS